jgi:hypothetical protein
MRHIAVRPQNQRQDIGVVLVNALVERVSEICLRCGESFYSQETIQRFEEIRRKLEQEETEGFEAIGQLFHVRR